MQLGVGTEVELDGYAKFLALNLLLKYMNIGDQLLTHKQISKVNQYDV